MPTGGSEGLIHLISFALAKVAQGIRLCACLFLLPFASPTAEAHPHVFVDGGVDFVFDNENGLLQALQVTWLYDEFETLYILSSNQLSLNAKGELDAADRQALIRQRSDWPDEFEGSAHLSIDGIPAQLKRPFGFDAEIVQGRLEITFTRFLEEPVNLERSTVEVAFYEASYFYAFAITNAPRLIGSADECEARVIPFQADADDILLKTALLKLGREETPDNERAGLLFADRILLLCA